MRWFRRGGMEILFSCFCLKLLTEIAMHSTAGTSVVSHSLAFPVSHHTSCKARLSHVCGLALHNYIELMCCE